MKLPIYVYGHPVLRQECVEVEEGHEGLKQLVADMYETMEASEGVGLAAPQIGKNLRLIVIDADVLGEDFPECKGRRFTLVNPEMDVLDGEKVTRSEGCLSVPGLSENVTRVEHILLNWLDEDFVEHEEEMSGFLARIVQHEMDHLDGKLYTDHISPIRKQLIKKKLNNIAEGRTSCSYATRTAPKKS